VGGYQVLSDSGKRGSIGAEVDVTFRRGRLDLAAGFIVGPNLGARIGASWALLNLALRIAVGVRGAGYPGIGIFGGGPAVFIEYGFGPTFAVTAIGSGEISPAAGKPLIALLGSLGMAAHF
jgi:hypothetical protein